jgi:hypothetical protein
MIALVALIAFAATPAFAELQNVVVGGDLRIRGNWYSSEATFDGVTNRNPLFQPPWTASFAPGVNPLRGVRWTAGQLPWRAIGNAPIVGRHDFDEAGASDANVEQRTKLSVRADFTNAVSAFVELDTYMDWGNNFRSNYITGNDFYAGDDVELYQSYIQAQEMWGYPLQLRVGRQELQLGSEWLLGNNDTAATFQGLSFDGIRLDYTTDVFSVTTFATKLAERRAFEQDGDIDFYGVYASWLGVEDMTIDAYYLYLRDAIDYGNDTYGVANWTLNEILEDAFGVDDYGVTNLHTIGLRGAGTFGAFDYEAEVAYQFGDANSVGIAFSPLVYGDDDAEYDNLGGNLELGYTFDMQYSPRVYVGAAYFEGNDDREISFPQWLAAQFWPYYQADASVSFNRLFSDWEYSEFHENTDMSNAIIFRGGVSAMVTEKVELLVTGTYFMADEPFSAPPSFNFLGMRVPWLPAASFWTSENDDELGWELGLYGTYNYTEDLSFELGYAHLFVEDGSSEGNFINSNGLGFNGGTSDEDADYIYLETQIAF